LYNCLCKINENIISEYISYEKTIYKEANMFYLKLIGYNSLFVIWNILLKILSFWYNKYYYIAGFTVNIFIVSQLYFVFNYYYYLLLESNKHLTKTVCSEKNKIKKIKEEAKTLEESTLTLDNWICEI
jgi:hypothetical protein